MNQFEEFRQANRENFHRIWGAAKAGQSLSPEEQRFADAMQAHPDYHNTWEFSDVVGSVDYQVEGVNPFLHLVAQSIIEAQLGVDDPPETAQALHRLQRSGVDRHQAIHQIAVELFEVMFPVLRAGKEFDRQR